MRYNELGQECPDDTPVEVPLGMKRPPTLQEQIQMMVRTQLSRAAERNGHETFEESNDFDVDDDDFTDQMTEHEFRTMAVEIPEDARETFEKFRKSRRKEAVVSGAVDGDGTKKKKSDRKDEESPAESDD